MIFGVFLLTNKKYCEELGCCWDSSIRGIAWCFHSYRENDFYCEPLIKPTIPNTKLVSCTDGWGEGSSCTVQCYKGLGQYEYKCLGGGWIEPLEEGCKYHGRCSEYRLEKSIDDPNAFMTCEHIMESKTYKQRGKICKVECLDGYSLVPGTKSEEVCDRYLFTGKGFDGKKCQSVQEIPDVKWIRVRN